MLGLEKGRIMENKNFEMEFLNDYYDKIALLGENNDRKTWLIKRKNSNKLFIWKELDEESVTVYKNLRNIKNGHLVEIKNIAEFDEKAVVIEEYISGDVLEDMIEECTITKEEAYDYVCQLLEVLSEIEKNNIVHRDITPKNILISSDKIVKLIDFGISRNTKEGKGQDTRILGTAGYAAPEQFGFMQTDGRSDIYSVGIVFHEMLTGKLPDGNKCVCDDYKKFIQKCINISPENRFQSAEEAYKSLTKCNIKNGKNLNNRTKTYTGKDESKMINDVYDYSKMPGFRSGVLWKKLVAMCIYFSLVMIAGMGFQDCKWNIMAIGIECVAVVMYIFSMVVIAGNYLNWYNRLPFFKGLDNVAKMFIRVVLSMVIFYAGTQLEEYIKNIVLK